MEDKKATFKALDSWRGIAAMLVALTHLSAAGAYFEFPLVQNGAMAVPFFFVLSGFVITHAYGDRLGTAHDIKVFVIRRFGRLYPLHLAALLVLVCIELAKAFLVSKGVNSGEPAFSGANSLEALGANLLLLHAIIPFGDFTWNGPSWSISTEFYTYLVFCATLFVFKIDRKVVVFLSFLFFLALACFIKSLDIEFRLMQGRGFLMCILGFFTGSLAYFLMQASRKNFEKIKSIPGLVMLAELVALAIVLLIFWFNPLDYIGTILFFSVAIYVYSFDGGRIASVLNTKPFQFLGKISYSIYMIHFVLLAIINGCLRVLQSHFGCQIYQRDSHIIDFGPAWAMDLFALAYVALTIAVAAVTYNLIEVPGRNFFNRLAKSVGAPQASRNSGQFRQL